ncbi:MAG TPA: alpha/beta hydrolase [Pyrinomonadaceae bacterium]|jgi:pimeloyl-ACP methyl ester carboxylesterase|nr:alpha/beta hydrolase [Pyrinomonadaceae bacterium]
MKNTTIILVHGAFADGSGWGDVIPLLEDEGYEVIAVQNPLTSYADDVATTRRVVDAQTKPVVLVGHSYGGAVITGAAVGATNVKALVYVAAFAPDTGDNLQALLEKYPSKIGAALAPDAAGFLYIDRSKFKEVFAADVPDRLRSVMNAAQKPIHSTIFAQKYEAAAWKDIPNWYLVATEDQAINPTLQRVFAERMKATTEEVRSSHVPFASQPAVVARIIGQAAAAVLAHAATAG